MTSISPPRKPNKWDDIIRVFFIIVLIGTIILLALGYISWKVFVGFFILWYIIFSSYFELGYSIPEIEFPDEEWDEEE